MAEIIDLYDNCRNVVGQAEYRAPLDFGLNRLFAHVWFVNKNGLFLLQQRVATTHRFPNKWSQTGGCVRTGEDSFDCAKRESFEELGINIDAARSIWIGTTKNLDNFVDIWLVGTDVACTDLTLQPDEVQDAKWVDVAEIRRMNNDDLTTPAVLPEMERILQYADSVGVQNVGDLVK